MDRVLCIRARNKINIMHTTVLVLTSTLTRVRVVYGRTLYPYITSRMYVYTISTTRNYILARSNTREYYFTLSYVRVVL